MQPRTRWRGSLWIAGALLVAPLLAAEPPATSGRSWIRISGTVAQAVPESFRLDYGDGALTGAILHGHAAQPVPP